MMKPNAHMKVKMSKNSFILVIQMCSGITRGSVLNAELYALRFQKLIDVHLFADCFMKICLQKKVIIAATKSVQHKMCSCAQQRIY